MYPSSHSWYVWGFVAAVVVMFFVFDYPAVAAVYALFMAGLLLLYGGKDDKV